MYKRRKDMVPGDVFWVFDRILQVLDSNAEIDPENVADWLGEWNIGGWPNGGPPGVFELVEEDA